MSLRKFRHVILTRFNLGLYDNPDPDKWMEHRMKLFEDTRESVLSQDEDFDWVLAMDWRTPNRYLQDIICDSRIAIIHEHPNTFRCEGWTITSRLDNDDIYLYGAIRAIQDAFEPREMLIDLKYEKIYPDGRCEPSGRMNPNSPFLSLIENGVKRTCYARPHSKMTQEYRGKFASEEIKALMVIHDKNLGNR